MPLTTADHGATNPQYASNLTSPYEASTPGGGYGAPLTTATEGTVPIYSQPLDDDNVQYASNLTSPYEASNPGGGYGAPLTTATEGTAPMYSQPLDDANVDYSQA